MRRYANERLQPLADRRRILDEVFVADLEPALPRESRERRARRGDTEAPFEQPLELGGRTQLDQAGVAGRPRLFRDQTPFVVSMAEPETPLRLSPRDRTRHRDAVAHDVHEPCVREVS